MRKIIIAMVMIILITVVKTKPVGVGEEIRNRIIVEANEKRFIPVKIILPKIKTSAQIIAVGLDDFRTSWFEPGSAPGEEGITVIAGHYTWGNGKGVFYDLNKLVIGDELEIENENGVRERYKVDKVTIYKRDEFPVADIYTKKGPSKLALITCQGNYSLKEKDYIDRLVVEAVRL